MKKIHSETGAVLVTALIMLVLLTMLGVTTLSTTIMEERMASNTQESAKNLQIADSGIQKLFNDGLVFVYGKEISPTTLTDYGNTSVDLTYKKDAGTEGTVGRSSRRALMWGTSFSRYNFELSATAIPPSGLETTVHAGAVAFGKSSSG